VTERIEHWNAVYGARQEQALTWFEAEPALSLELIAAHAQPGEAILDVGGGASRLVDALLDRGCERPAVLDVSQAALDASRARLGARAAKVDWIVADITRWRPDRSFGLWHDRAVFHFLTDPADRAAYVAAMTAALRPGGTAIVMTFAEDGPETCSGLPVVRYAPESLAAEIERLAPGAFRPIAARRHLHLTPKGNRQSFQASVFRRAD
jgi:SAM-dependent methyltransferase